ncbi:MAG: right-handed parallel beta-helix repeat-containing protein [Candidatus Pacebacteria bacterium]|nr:right-handed parallel beta-helix repeat-containing protein [Candidatus Paceibacterota bacterium]
MKKAILLFIIFSPLLFSRAVFAYNDTNTHPALTDETIDFYNSISENKLTDEEKEWIISGAEGEDTPPRWTNHFYDPVYDEGFTGERGPSNIINELSGKYSDVWLSVEDAVSAKIWSQNQELQAKYRLYKGNKTWEKAIYEYVKNNNKQEAFYSLGFVLHLLQDMAVPDHTRNDSHPPTDGSPYENYCVGFNRNNFSIQDKIKGNQPASLTSLDNYFDYLANYSNKYFFSKDTINDEKYENPKIIKVEGDYGYGPDNRGNEFKIVGATREIKNGELKISYFLRTQEEKVFESYWSRLSTEAVLSGAGVIELFFSEAEKAKNNQNLLEEPPQEKSAIVSIFMGDFSFAGEYFRMGKLANGAKDWFSNTFNNFASALMSPFYGKNNLNSGLANVVFSESSEAEPPAQSAYDDEIEQPQILPQILPQETIQAFETQTQETSAEIEVLEEILPEAVITEVIPEPEQIPDFLKTIPIPPIAMGGGGSPSVGSTVLPQTNSTQNSSNQPESSSFVSAPPEPPADTTPPDISFEIAECADSFSEEGCVIAPQIIHLSWQSVAGDIEEFELTINGTAQALATTSTSTEFSAIQDNAAHSFSIRAKDSSDNYSDPQSIDIEIFSAPIVINEIAWGGTSGRPNDEWVELYNKSSSAINLANWTLSSADSEPYIILSGKISQKGYCLLERTDDNTISDIAADLIYTGALNNTGDDHLTLYFASTTIDQTPLGNWPAGTSAGFSMERYDSKTSGDNPSNWLTNDTPIANGLASGPEFYKIAGTPKQRNSANYLVNKNQNIFSDIVLKKSESPYFIDGTVINVSASATLTIEPGVVIKFHNDAGLKIDGKILAQGTENDKIVFTSIMDDEYGGDTNGADATTTLPYPGSWFGVVVSETAPAGSIFDYAILRYAGKYYTGQTQERALLASKGSVITVSNSIFEYSKVYGLKLAGSNSLVKNNIFRNNNTAGITSPKAALYAGSCLPTISGNLFEKNNAGIYLADAPGIVSGNTFTNNAGDAILSFASVGEFTNNTASGNLRNSVSIFGNITEPGENLFLKADNLAYYFMPGENIQVSTSSSLTIEKGAVVKSDGKPLWVYGNLVIAGENSGDVIFTSFYDDTAAGDSNADMALSSAAPGQFAGIEIKTGAFLRAKGFEMRYSGHGNFEGGNSAGMEILGGVADISNAVFSQNYAHGIFAQNSPSLKISNTSFKNHTITSPYGVKAALAVYSTIATFSNITFENNLIGVIGNSESVFTIDPLDSIIWTNNTENMLPVDLF